MSSSIRHIRVLVAMTLVVALSLSGMATAEAGLPERLPAKRGFKATALGTVTPLLPAVDDNVPGVPIPQSPISDTLDAENDWDDVYAIDLVEGTVLVAELTAAADTDFDLGLWKPGTTDINDENQFDDIAEYAASLEYPEILTYEVPAGEGGTYYLDAYAFEGSGAYELEWYIAEPSYLFFDNEPPVVKYMEYATFTLSLEDATGPLAGQWIDIYTSRDGEEWAFHSSIYSDTGDYSFRIRGLYSEYVAAEFTGDGTYAPASSDINWYYPKVYLTGPNGPDSATALQTFTMYGQLKPRHAGGANSVKLLFYKWNGSKFEYYKGVWARNYSYPSWTTYKANTRLLKGRWRVRAWTPWDTWHAATYSPDYHYMTVY